MLPSPSDGGSVEAGTSEETGLKGALILIFLFCFSFSSTEFFRLIYLGSESRTNHFKADTSTAAAG